jgi:hypothetical protein
MADSKKRIAFLPFHAINEFMRPDFRQAVIHATLQALPSLPNNYQSAVNGLIKKSVQIPGFRNSLQAPLALKVKPVIAAFEKNPAFVAAILSAWAFSKPELAQNVYGLLQSRSWEVMPPESDRTKLPGFLPDWPENEEFTALDQAYHEMFPQDLTNADDINLMVVWLSGRLPWEKSTNENGGESDA